MNRHIYYYANNGVWNIRLRHDEKPPRGFTRGKLFNGGETARKTAAWTVMWPEGQGQPKPGCVLHHRDPEMRLEEPERYSAWLPEDLEIKAIAEVVRDKQTQKAGFRRGKTGGKADVARQLVAFGIHPLLKTEMTKMARCSGVASTHFARLAFQKLWKQLQTGDSAQLLAGLEQKYSKLCDSLIAKRQWLATYSPEEVAMLDELAELTGRTQVEITCS